MASIQDEYHTASALRRERGAFLLPSFQVVTAVELTSSADRRACSSGTTACQRHRPGVPQPAEGWHRLPYLTMDALYSRHCGLQQLARHRSRLNHFHFLQQAHKDQTMTFMIIWQNNFEVSFTLSKRLFRLALGQLVIVLFCENMEKRHADDQFEIDSAKDFLSHLLRHPAVRKASTDVPGVTETYEGIVYQLPVGEYVVPEWALKTGVDKDAA
ncbi:MAG: hypothetical protein HOE83_12590 [Alphaproteobacteria bacterium]|nr:hypothetical protein [Alphaproteobacteria bacterium]MBT4084612.1 hypothetical protein [Alphaproteobacteria bacterium]